MIFKLKTLNFIATKILESFKNVDIYTIPISNKISSCEKKMNSSLITKMMIIKLNQCL